MRLQLDKDPKTEAEILLISLWIDRNKALPKPDHEKHKKLCKKLSDLTGCEYPYKD